jgi:hypothetical protein
MFNRIGELKLWKENGGNLISFKKWLIAHKGSGDAARIHVNQDANASDMSEETVIIPLRTRRGIETETETHRSVTGTEYISITNVTRSIGRSVAADLTTKHISVAGRKPAKRA